jgi:membrane protein implicated in regulation of membrane protease activity
MSHELILTTFFLTGAIVGFIALHSSFLLTKVNSTYVTWVYPIIVVVALTLAYEAINDVQGYPINGRPAVEFEYLGHTMVGQEAIVIADVGYAIKAYRFTPTAEEQQSLQSAAEGKEKGKQYTMRMVEGEPTQAELIRLDQTDPKD